ncbi:hypothetical protein [Kocuria palustris]|uniref:hypothetical protein n=1 Tax=Kocuria palustris TaxID=71999 RepID=UPI0011AB21CA|nr:hypothetical protein [Kocuria palustris]
MPFARACWILFALMWLSAGLGAVAVQLMLDDAAHEGVAMTLFVLCAPVSVLLWFVLRAVAGFTMAGHPLGRWLAAVLARPRALASAAALATAGLLLPRAVVVNSSWVEWAVDGLVIGAVALVVTTVAAAAFRRAVPSDGSDPPPQ